MMPATSSGGCRVLFLLACAVIVPVVALSGDSEKVSGHSVSGDIGSCRRGHDRRAFLEIPARIDRGGPS